MPFSSPSRAKASPARTKRRTSDNGAEGTVVAIRMRPLNDNEEAKKRVWHVMPENNAVHQTKKDGTLLDRIAGRTYFNYDRTFGEEVQTVEVYNDIAKPIVTSVVNGLNGTIFAYGQTSSGKTYTMQGSGSIEDGSHSDGGIVHMAVRDIFSHIESQKDRMFLVRASFLEIYNEDVRDLLSHSTESLQIREDPRHGVFVQSVEETVTDFESLLKILFYGEKSRQVASTGMNERSSRSHTIFRITIESRKNVQGNEGTEKENDDNDSAVLVSTLNLVDLAGSESVRHTGASGDRQKEGGMINQSLLTLSRVIQALGTNQGHVNFRDSKLTRLLQSSLSGNAKMAVICCATPSELYLEETRSTLQFASRASLVKTNAQVNEVLDDRSMIKRLQRELAEAKKNSSAPGAAEIQAMEDKAAIESKEKLLRLTSCLLNGGHLFPSTEYNKNSMVPSPIATRTRERKRRQSEGNFLAGIKSPLKLSQQMNMAPLTEPRRKKKREVQLQEASPKSQLNIVREALSSRSNFARALQDTVSNMKFVIQNAETRFKEEKEASDAKITEFQERYEALQQDHHQSQMEKSTARDENSRLMDESAKLHEDYELMKSQNKDLQQQLEQILSDFDVQRQQNEVKMNELETLRVEITEVEMLLRKEEEKAHEKDELLAQTREQLSRFEVEQESMKEHLERQKAEINAQSEAHKVKTQSLQEEINRLKLEGESLSTQKVELEAKLETAETSLEDVEEELEISRADMSSRIELLEKKLEESVTENTQVKQKLEETIVTKDSMEQKIADLSARLDEEQAQVRNLNFEKNDLQTKLEKAETSLEDVEDELEIARSDMCGRIESLEVKLQSSETETLQVQKELDEMKTKKEELEEKLESCQKEFESLTNEKSAVENELTKASDDKTELQSILQQSEEKIAELTASVQEQQAQIEKLKAERCDLESKFETTKDSLEKSEDELKVTTVDMSSRIESLEDKLKAAESETAKVKQDMEEALSNKDSTLKELEEKLESMSTEKEQVEANFADASDRQAELQSQHQLLEEKVTELTFSVEQHQKEIEKLHSEKKSLESVLDAAEKALEESEEQLEKTKNEMEGNLDQLEEKLKAAVAETTEVRKSFEESSAEKDAMYNELEDKLGSVLTEKAELDEKLVETANEKTELQSQYQQLSSKFEQLQSDIESVKSEKTELEAKLKSTEASLHNAEENHEITKADMSSKVDCLNGKLAEAESELSTVKQELEDIIANHNEAQQELDEKLKSMAESNEQLEADLSKADEEKEMLQDEGQQLEEKISTLERILEERKIEFDKLCNEKSDFESKSAESKEQLEADLSKAEEEKEMLQDEQEQLKEKISTLERILEERKIEFDKLCNEKSDFESKSAELKEQLEADLSKAEEEKEMLQDEQEQLEEKISALERVLEEQKVEFNKLGEAKGDIESRLASSETELQEAQEILSVLDGDLKSALEQKSLIEEQLSNELKEKEVWKISIEKRNGDVNEELDSLRNEILSLHGKLEDAEQWKQAAVSDQEKSEETIRNLQSFLKEQKKNAAMLAKEHDEVCQMLGKANEDGSVLEEENLDLWSNVSDLGEKLLSLGTLLLQKEEEAEDIRKHWYRTLHENADVKTGVDMANSKSMFVESQLNVAVQNLNEQKALNQDLESKLAHITSELNKLAAEKDSMQVNHSDAEGAIVDLKRKLAHAEGTILQIRNSNQEIIAEQEEAYRELESRLKELFQGLEALKSEKSDLKEQILQLENEKKELQTRCDSLGNEKDEIDELLEQTAQDLSANEETINDLHDRLNMSEEQLKQIAADNESKISTLQERLTGSLKEIEVLKAKKFDLETRIEELESGLDCQLQTLQEKLLEAESENEELRIQADRVDVNTATNRSELMEVKTMTTAILAEKDAVEALLSESQLQVHQLEEQLDNARAEHDKVLTSTALQLNEQQKKLETLILAKEAAESNLNKRLKDRELERDEATTELQNLYSKNKELSQSLASCVTKEREAELVSQIADLKQEIIELKQLLVSANESEERGRKEVEELETECVLKSRELDDALYRISLMEDELRMAQIPPERETDRSHDGLVAEIQEQKAELEKILDRERIERQKAEEDLKRRMGEEQRLLIHEAEEKFSELRDTASELERRLEQSESEGYQARQEAEELRDQNKEIEDKCIALEGALSDLKSFVTDQENKMSALESDLQKAKAESYALKEAVIEMKERARKASRESEKALRENQISSGEVAALKKKISSLEQDAAQQLEQYQHLQTALLTARTEATEMDEDHKDAIKSKDAHIERVEARLIELEGESKRLAVELRMARVAKQHSEGDSELHQQIEELTAQMKKKDSRIKKLEQVRLTKEQVESIKKMKTDSLRLEEECKRLTRKNAELLERMHSSGSQPSSIELEGLRSEKKALEKKLMKYVSHCQSLMDDKASMMDALRSCSINIGDDSDPNDAVIALCDKYREAKRSQAVSNENVSSAELENKNKVLIAQIKEMEDAEREFSTRAAEYQKEIELLKVELSTATGCLEETIVTLKRELSTLREEALQAIQEKKNAKKKLQRVQAELEMMRMNASMDNPTVDFTVSDLQLIDNGDDSPPKPTTKERTSTRATSSLSTSMQKESRPPLGDSTNARATLNQSGATKSNSNNILNQNVEKSVLNSSSKPSLAPGLGEAGQAAMYEDENTQECKQS